VLSKTFLERLNFQLTDRLSPWHAAAVNYGESSSTDAEFTEYPAIGGRFTVYDTRSHCELIHCCLYRAGM